MNAKRENITLHKDKNYLMNGKKEIEKEAVLIRDKTIDNNLRKYG